MTDRVWIVLALVAAVILIVTVARQRPRLQSRRLAETGLDPGVYLLTSEGCATCERARATLNKNSVAFTELRWQTESDVFERLGVDAVASVLVVGLAGDARWWRGAVPSAARLSSRS